MPQVNSFHFCCILMRNIFFFVTLYFVYPRSEKWENLSLVVFPRKWKSEKSQIIFKTNWRRLFVDDDGVFATLSSILMRRIKGCCWWHQRWTIFLSLQLGLWPPSLLICMMRLSYCLILKTMLNTRLIKSLCAVTKFSSLKYVSCKRCPEVSFRL